ncbi:MAG: putative transcriptional regulatory protein [Chlamydiae bacterium]|nr:putative transcriptional regulatory protein [Chlamydiota bacterium]
MAGHSKWANIKHKKDRADKQKGKLFSRHAKEIISAVKLGGPDPKSNSRLRLAIQKAKAINMPSDNIERNIKKAANPDQADFLPLTYEIYGHGGVGIIVDAVTDNKNRTASDMRIATNKRGGTIASPGSVAFSFDRKGVIQVGKSAIDEDKLFQEAIEAGAEDFESAEESYMITTDPSELYAVKEKLEAKGFKVDEAEIEMIPQTLIECDEETSKSNMALIEWLEDLEDVNAVYHNLDL